MPRRKEEVAMSDEQEREERFEEAREQADKQNKAARRGFMSRKDMYAALIKLGEELEAQKREFKLLSDAHDRTRRALGYEGDVVSAGERGTSVGEYRRRRGETDHRGVPYEEYEGRGLEQSTSAPLLPIDDAGLHDPILRPRTMDPSALPARLPAAAMSPAEIRAQQNVVDEKPSTTAARKALQKHKKREEEEE